MLVIERKRGPACAAGSGGMEQPDRPSEGGVRLPRLRGYGSVHLDLCVDDGRLAPANVPAVSRQPVAPTASTRRGLGGSA
jgi:hypothetical protein